MNCYLPNFQGFILMKNAINNQVGMLGDMFLWLVANLKRGVIYFIKQALPPNISAGSVWPYTTAFYSPRDESLKGQQKRVFNITNKRHLNGFFPSWTDVYSSFPFHDSCSHTTFLCNGDLLLIESNYYLLKQLDVDNAMNI